MSREIQRFRVGIMAWCLMTNHVHLIAVPEDERALSRTIGEARKRYSRMRNLAEGMRGLGEQKVDIFVKDRNLLGLVAYWKEFLQGED
jgi:putative transposase